MQRLILTVGLLLVVAQTAQSAQTDDKRPADQSPPSRLWAVSNSKELLKAVDELNVLAHGPSNTSDRPSSLGGTINLAPGIYTLKQTILFENTAHINLIGSGWNTVIRRVGSGNALEFKACSFAVIRDLLLTGDPMADQGTGIVMRGHGCSSSEINRCRICNFRDSGVRLEGTLVQPMSSVTIRNCHLIGNRVDQLSAFCSNDFFILTNQFGTHQSGQTDPSGEVPRTGAVLDHCSAGTYSQNYHWDQQVALRMGPGACYNRIQNNRFEESRESGS